MTPQEKADELVNKHRIVLIQSDTDAGEEIICTTIAKQCALIACNEVLGYMGADRGYEWWMTVKLEIEKL